VTRRSRTPPVQALKRYAHSEGTLPGLTGIVYPPLRVHTQ
jgi:hypothetical protein